ncbi:transcriptional regulator with XRE-family HTH domain [Nakamurella sp. UYEF19]|uniref:helix-turn-helix domain-containing protein n=1 Tax=Nakamurella sp. UYEF19 TaxID=1756392 RepID=UPI003393BF1E
MDDNLPDLVRIGLRARELRGGLGLTLDELASRSHVSRSMLSEVERGNRSPTVLVLDRIATGLGTTLARLLRPEESGHSTGRGKSVVLRHRDQDVLRDPSGWERRILNPVLPGVEFEFMRTTLGPGVDAGIFDAHGPGSREYLAVESGSLSLSLDGTTIALAAGDSIYYGGDCAHGFSNPEDEPCVYYLVMDVSGHGARPVTAR